MNAESIRWRTPEPLGWSHEGLFSSAALDVQLLALPGECAGAIAQALVAGASEAHLLDLASESGITSGAAWLQLFETLCRVGRVVPEFTAARGVFAVLHGKPVAGLSASVPEELKLSRFAVLTPAEGSRLLAEEPIVDLRVEVTAGTLELLGPLRSDDDPTAIAVRRLAFQYGLAVEASQPQQSWWEPHDRYFHWRTRRDDHGHLNGATYPHSGARAPLGIAPDSPPGSSGVPARAHAQRIRADRERVTLVRDPPGERPANSPETGHGGLDWLLAQRRTTRECEVPLSTEDLLGFLRAHAVREVVEHAPGDATSYPQTRRLYPSGGATYELELCVTTSGVVGLDDAAWWFDAEHGQLVMVDNDDRSVAEMVDDALVSSGGVGTPRAIITYALRIGRNSWKYEGMAYRLALLDAGVLYQHAYLVAAELGLGICGLGNGNSATFTKVFKQDPEDLTSLAEVMLTGRLHGKAS